MAFSVAFDTWKPKPSQLASNPLHLRKRNMGPASRPSTSEDTAILWLYCLLHVATRTRAAPEVSRCAVFNWGHNHTILFLVNGPSGKNRNPFWQLGTATLPSKSRQNKFAIRRCLSGGCSVQMKTSIHENKITDQESKGLLAPQNTRGQLLSVYPSKHDYISLSTPPHSDCFSPLAADSDGSPSARPSQPLYRRTAT